ncbi:anti-sigma factor [Specibacter cremeus]|uniref:anti-sigma factor n=1 Tax=Specibacter cremeus TaxID=1629051 RepID=UPI000F7A57E5|nr:anti-sigma factor [Specibacter cremeus]
MDEQLHLLTGAYALNALDDVERAAFERHALGDGQTRQEVRELSETAALLAAGAPAQAPPPQLKSDVMAAIRNTRQLPATGVAKDTGYATVPRASRRGWTTAGARPVPPRRRRLAAVLAAAAVVVLAAGGVGGWVLGQANRNSTLEQQLGAAQAQQHEFTEILGAADARLSTADVPGGGTVAVAWSVSADRAAVLARGMPALPAGKAYELWFITAAGAVPAGMLPEAAQGSAARVLQGRMDGATQVGITVEPAGGSKAPTTAPIVLQKL